MEDKEKISNWLKRNLDERVAGNTFLTVEENLEISKALNELLELNEKGSTESQIIIDLGNSALEKMNFMMNEKRISNMISVQDFSDYVIKEKEILGDFEPCKNIMSMFDILYKSDKYDLAAEYIRAINFKKLKHDGIPLWVLVSTNPVTPLMRSIPKKEKIKELLIAREEFYNNACEFYKKNGQFETLLGGDKHKPEDYDKIVADYDSLYIRGAPKE